MSSKYALYYMIYNSLVHLVKALEECGYISYCLSGYHCCSAIKQTCCPYGRICINDDTACLHIAVIIVPVVGFVGTVVAVGLCCYCCKRQNRRGHTGTVLQPAPGMPRS